MDHGEELRSLGCNGEELGHDYGSWIGHVLPGSVFIVWGVWHVVNTFATYIHLLARDGHDRAFCSHASYRLQVARRAWPIESALKAVASVVGLVMELWSGGSYQALLCGPETKHPGWFRGENINNWQHAVLYLPIMASGLVDLLAMMVPLPRGTPHAFLALVFVFEALIMGTHTKPVPLDSAVHQWLAAISSALALVTLAEAFANRHVLVATARTALMVLQGSWLCAIGRIMFEGRAAWDTHTMGPHNYVPVLLCWHIIFTAIGLVLCYVLVALCQEYAVYRLPGASYSPLRTCGAPNLHAHASQECSKEATQGRHSLWEVCRAQWQQEEDADCGGGGDVELSDMGGALEGRSAPLKSYDMSPIIHHTRGFWTPSPQGL